ncbi:hypothetical protein [Arcobacter cloacae]|uniref:Uncharacterized protein n=1 Tax=Arcobacter cloacae TaxID=1054034 RepID=A0A4Q0ZC99_9BACT|nr:hypothetical protein [Arcobacter cloacae]RXJ83914.1 hypothetical protein CRU90_07520 [Arcobacter cloacae]
MSFLENISNFFSLLKESNYNLALVYSQDSSSFYSVLLLLFIVILIVGYFIRDSFKKAELSKLISNITKVSNFSEFEQKLSKIADEISKRGLEIANKLNLSKEDILTKGLVLTKDFDIKQKIEAYKKISSDFSLISKNTKKYNIEELSKFYEEKSISLLEDNLLKQIENYYKNVRFTQTEAENIDFLVSYANSLSNPLVILKPLENEINKFSFTFNLELFKFIKKLDKNSSKVLSYALNKKIEELFCSEREKISVAILAYVLKTDEKQKVYDYISNLKDNNHLQTLYFNFFAKSKDIDLDLAFIKNEIEIVNDYKEYINSQITYNWKDLKFIKHIINSSGVLRVIGHIDYRNVLERIEKLENEVDFNATVAKILEVSRNAEKIAKEAKAIARSK